MTGTSKADHKAALHFDPTDYQYSEGENLKAAYLELRELANMVIDKQPNWLKGQMPVVDKVGDGFVDVGTMEFPAFNAAFKALRKALEE